MYIIKEYKNWVSTSTADVRFYDEESTDNNYYKNIDKKSITNFINEYRKMFNNNISIKDIKLKAKQDIDDNLFFYLDLDSFFKSLRVKQKINPESAYKYFDDYISELPRIFYKIENDFSNYDLKDEFTQLNRLKNTNKEERKTSNFIFENEIDALLVEFLKMTEWIKNTNQKVLITLDGRDSAGKGSFIKLIEDNMPEKVVSHTWFDIPTEYEKKNWFYRYSKALPKPGHLKFFDRSWYNRAVNDPVNHYCTEEQYTKFMKDVVPYEKKLIDSNIIYIKMWFSIDKETQEFRFDIRKSHPIKYWKFSPSDAKAVEKYDIFTFYKEQMFVNTSTKKSPWVVIDMNDKKIGQLNAMRYILSKVPYPNKNEDIIKPFKTRVYEI